MSIESVFIQWISEYSGVNTVIQMPFGGDRPDESYLGFQLMTFNYSEFDEKLRLPKDATFITHEYKNNALLQVSIHAYGDKAYQAINQLRVSSSNWIARNLLAAEDIAFNKAGSLNNLAALEEAAYRDHWQADFEFNIVLKSALDIHRINEWLLTGTWPNPDYTINSNLKYPKG